MFACPDVAPRRKRRLRHTKTSTPITTSAVTPMATKTPATAPLFSRNPPTEADLDEKGRLAVEASCVVVTTEMTVDAAPSSGVDEKMDVTGWVLTGNAGGLALSAVAKVDTGATELVWAGKESALVLVSGSETFGIADGGDGVACSAEVETFKESDERNEVGANNVVELLTGVFSLYKTKRKNAKLTRQMIRIIV